MRSRIAADQTQTDRLAELADDVAALRDLFSRRLLEDKAKNRLIDDLHEQLERANGAVSARAELPLAAELLLLVDRLSHITLPVPSDIDSVRDELLEILSRRGVRELPGLDSFDPAVHDIARTVPASDELPAGTVVETVRPGYKLGEALVRPARVVIAAEQRASSQEPTT